MRLKVAIIDHLGAHGSSHHFYLFGQAKGLLANNTEVYLYTNSNTVNPLINNLSFLKNCRVLFSNFFVFQTMYFCGLTHFNKQIII